MIRISDLSIGAIYDESDLFMVKASITVNAPSSSTPALKVLDAANTSIAWSTPCTGSATMGDVNIQFSKTGAAPWTDVATVSFNTSPYVDWTPPINSITSNAKTAKIRITDADNSEVTDDSDAFEIEGKLTLDEPAGTGFFWQPGVKHNIKWTPTGTFANVKLEYSTNAFADEDHIQSTYIVANSAHNTQKSYEWTVPADIGDTMAIRISDNADPNVSAVSGTFKTANLQISYPVENQDIVCETSEHITFTVSGSISKVTLEYSTSFDTGEPPQRIWNPTPIAADYVVTSGQNTYTPWTVPLNTSTHSAIRVTHASAGVFTEVADITDDFTIRGGFAFTDPLDGDRVPLTGVTKLVKWNTLGTIGWIYVDYRYKDNFTNQWTLWGPANVGGAAIANTDQYLWTLPNIISNNVEFRVTDRDNSAATTTSDPFVLYGALTLTQPNGPSSKLKAGQQDADSQVKWTKVGPIPTVDLYLSTAGDVEENYVYMTSIGTVLEYNWAVPTNKGRSNNCFISVRDPNDSEVRDESDQPFWIMENIQVTAPVDHPLWVAGESSDIKWTSEKIATTVDIKYCKDSPYTSWTPIESGWANDQINKSNTYPWNIPTDQNLAHTYRIRVSDSNATYTDYAYGTSTDFTIQGGITVLSPNGGTAGANYADREKWTCDIEHPITWTSKGNITHVDLHYRVKQPDNSWGTWQEIYSHWANQAPKEYPWTIPVTLSAENVLIRVKDNNALFPDTYDASDNPFKIMPWISMEQPTGDTVWDAGTQPNIMWTKHGPSAFDKVKIEYSINNPDFTDYEAGNPFDVKTIIASKQYSGSVGSHAWTIPPEAVGYNNVRVRIASTDAEQTYTEVAAISDPFIVRAQFTSIIPNGGQKWIIGDTETITWTQTGHTFYPYSDPVHTPPRTQMAVKLTCYKQTNPTTREVIGIVPSGANGGSYNWTIPNTLSPSLIMVSPGLIMRVEDPNYENPNDTDAYLDSAAPFKIMPGIVVTGPGTNAQWFVGDTTRYITWTYTDTQPTGTLGNVSMFYSQSGGAEGSWVSISGSSTAVGNMQWLWPNVPDKITAQLKIKVASTGDADVYGVAPYGLTPQGKPDRATFTTEPYAKISSKFVISPSINGLQLVVGGELPFTWTNTGTVDNIDLHYSYNNFQSASFLKDLSNVSADNIANAKAFTWKVPDIFAEVGNSSDAHNIKVRVRSHTDTDANSVTPSDPLIRIKGSLWVKAPVSLESLEIGKVQRADNSAFIKWGWTGTMPKVKITYFTGFDTAGTVTVNNGIAAITGSGTSWMSTVHAGDHIGIGTTNPKNIAKWYTVQSVSSNTQITVSPAYEETTGSGNSYCVGKWYPLEENYETPNDGIVGNGAGAGGINSEYSCGWTIPDKATDSAIIKIQDARASELDVEANSDPFKIIGFLDSVSPLLDEKLPVASVYRIKWKWGGTMPTVKILLSTNGDAGPFNPIDQDNNPATTPNTGIVTNGVGPGGLESEAYFDWVVQNNISPNCKIKIVDPRVETVVNDVSPKFKIQGAFTIITPLVALNDNKTPLNYTDDFYECRWLTGETHNVSWTTFGTISSVDLTYAKDFDEDGDIDDDDFADEVAMTSETNFVNGATGQTTTFPWLVPDIVQKDVNNKYSNYTNVKIRVYDHNDHEVFGQGPVSAGGVSVVKVDYAKIKWDIRNLITNERIKGLKVVQDTPTPWVAEGLASPITNEVPAGRWTAEWSHKDFGPISETFLVGWDAEHSVWLNDRTIARTMESLVVHIWRAYSEFSYDVNTDRLDMTSWLERDGSLVPGSMIIDVRIYAGNNRIKRKTILVDEGANLDSTVDDKFLFYNDILDDLDVTGGVKMWIGDRLNDNDTPEDSSDDYEEHRDMANVISEAAQYKVSEMAMPTNFSGFFQQNWTPTSYTAANTTHAKLEAGKVYTVATYVALKSGANFITPVSFSVTIPTTMAEVKDATEAMEDTVNSVLDKPISEVSEEIQGSLSAQTILISQKLDAQTAIIDTATDEMKATIDTAITEFQASVQESIVALEAGVEQAVTAGAELEATAKKYSWDATVTPNPALTGDTVSMKLQGPSGLYPMLTIYRWDEKSIVEGIIMTQDATGSYVYEFEADSRFPPGKAYTYIISEQTTGGLVAGSGSVETMSLTTIAGLAAAAPGAERIAKKALDAIQAVEAVVVSKDNINIALTLQNLKQSVDMIPSAIAKEGPSSRLTEVVTEISNRIKTLAGDEGYDMTSLFEEAITESPTIRDIRKSTDEIQGAADVLNQLFEAKLGGLEDAFVSTSLEPGSVKFKVVAANPSKVRPQAIQIKYYLPEEVKPKDIMDLAGLALEYDAEKSIYYVYMEKLELNPGEVRAFEVEVEDIWMVSDSKLADLNSRTETIMAKLENTEYYESTKPIAESIYARLQEIRGTQSDDTISRSQHIGLYRQNVLVVEDIKEDIARLEKTLATAGGPLAPDMLAKTKIKAEEPSKSMTWIVIFVIIIFTGLLTAVLFFTWLRQARATKEAILEAKKTAFPEGEDSVGGSKEGGFDKSPPEPGG